MTIVIFLYKDGLPCYNSRIYGHRTTGKEYLMAKTADTIAIYSRKSRYTGKGESIGNQIDLCREYIRTHYGDAAAEHTVVFEDEGCCIPTSECGKFDALPPEYSHLYLAIGGVLAGVICIADPLRPEAARVLRALRGLGITNTVMMTGDSERTAAAIAKQVGVDHFFAEVLPEDKAAFVQKAKSEGHTVVMIGDGINDSPALSAADVGIAINSGAAIAREIADVTIKADSLEELVILKTIANSLQRRVSANYRFVLTFNSALIALGALGILQPASSAMLHNLSTIGISLKSMTNLIPEEKTQKALAEKN